MIKAVIFDLDGTLVNSLADLGDATNFALEKGGFPTHETEAFKYFVGDGMPMLIERALPENHRDNVTIQNTLAVFMAYYKEHYVDKTVPYEGVLSMLEELNKKGIVTAVVSNKVQEMAITVAHKLLGNGFKIICGKKEGYPAKPDPTLTLKVISNLRVTPEECLFVGDSGMDMAVSENAGCVSVGVLWGFRGEEELLNNGADYIINRPDLILKVIDNEK